MKNPKVPLQEACDTLGILVSELAFLSRERLKNAYRKKVFDFHPDRGGDTEKMKRLNWANEHLLKKVIEPREKNEEASRQTAELFQIFTVFQENRKECVRLFFDLFVTPLQQRNPFYMRWRQIVFKER